MLRDSEARLEPFCGRNLAVGRAKGDRAASLNDIEIQVVLRTKNGVRGKRSSLRLFITAGARTIGSGSANHTRKRGSCKAGRSTHPYA